MTTKAERSRGMPRRTAPVATGSSRTPLVIAAVVVGFILIAAVLALALGGTSGGGALVEPATQAVAVAGDPLPAYGDGNDTAIGSTIPTITGTDLAGEPISVGPEDGPMAIVLLAHWCSHCQAEVPLLVDYLGSTGMPDGVRLVGISTSINEAQPNYPPSSWLEREGWNVPTMNDDANSRALAALGMNSFPAFVFVDADGRVVSRTTGEIPIQTFDQIVNSIAP